ncbi:MAG: FAD-binding oxidoreductase [Armatimonadetes bacterium]|nr:FAD-binding oxidoreductase [Armatimonadota bacterium]
MLPEKTAVKSLSGLGGWGRFPVTDVEAVRPEKARDLSPVGGQCIPRGLGRAYGDAAVLTGGTVVMTERLNRFLEFDPQTGVLRAEAGVSLRDVLRYLVPQGWFLPVTPGTKNCTLGGCFAADVHGKNHHRDGTFSRHVYGIELVLANGERVRCGPDDRPDLFWATAGGMGLTGIVSELTLQLTPVESAYMMVRHTRSPDLDRTFELLTDPKYDARYTVAWIDCLAKGPRLGRGVFMAGEHAKKSEVSLRNDPLVLPEKRVKPFPFDLPGWALNPLTVKTFNRVYDAFQGRKGEFVCDYDKYFYPLDGIEGWNRMYGKRGFVQYQYVLPTAGAFEGTRTILEELSAAGRASFLAVLKRFGPQGPGMLSFPTEGLTLALDIPMADGLMNFLERMDQTVSKHGGRLYLAKDSRMKPDVFRAGYPRIDEFCAVRSAVDPGGRFDSDLARRIGLCR